MKLEILLHELAIAPPSADVDINAVVYDSRQVQPGSLFVAVQGAHVDGHAFLAQAVARGAAAVVVDQRHYDAAAHGVPAVPLGAVPNSRAVLAPLAAAIAGHPARRLRTIGVTGTKGKSTTTDLLGRVLENTGATTGMISTVDFKVGSRRWPNKTRQSTPEAPEVQALLGEMVGSGCQYAVIEATSHALSPRWNRLGGCAFDVAVFLNITHEHLDYHGSFAQYRSDKAQLFAMLAEDDGDKWAIVNADDPNHGYFLDAAPARAQRLTYALDAPADVQASDVVATPSGAQFRVATPWGTANLRLHLPGRFNVANALATLTVALSQGVSLDQAVAALEQVRGVRGRMQPITAGQPFDVIVDYAHNPDSFEQVMSMLRPLVAGKMIVVFGSAGERDHAKRAIQGEIAARYCDLLVLTDEDPRGEDRQAIIDDIAVGVKRSGKHSGDYLAVPDRHAAIAAAIGWAEAGDLVLLLGKGHEGNIIYADHSLPWDEAEAARAALRDRGYDNALR